MSYALRPGQTVKIGPASFLILQKLSCGSWRVRNNESGEWCTFAEEDLLERFTRNELTFDPCADDLYISPTIRGRANLDRTLASYPDELVALAQRRLQYLKEIDRRQPIGITPKYMVPLIKHVSEQIDDTKPPAWRTLSRDYRKWLNAGRDIRALILRHADRGLRGTRMLPEVRDITDDVVEQLYMTAERKRVPEVHLEIVRRLADANQFRRSDPLPVPSRRTIYREIARKSPYDVMVARYGKRRADMEFRLAGVGPGTSRVLQRVSMDHTPADLIVVDDTSMLPLGRPTITSALDEHTRCPLGFYTGFEPPSCLSVMRCLKHSILPKTYVPRNFPCVKNHWECYGVPEIVVVDNPPEFHSTHFERACLQIGIDIQYSKVLIPWYKGKLERFQGTMNHDLLHGNPGTTFSNILERDDYDPTRHAVVLLSTFQEMLHKWIVDVYLQTPHRGIKDTPAHRWQTGTVGLPPPLPKSASELDIVLGMTAQRVVFHYGIELEGLKYNGPELGELRRRIGTRAKVELTFDPGDLGHVNVFDPLKDIYIRIPCLDVTYANGLSLWQHKVIRRYAQLRLNSRTDLLGLAQAKAELRALVERDFTRKSTRGRKRHARFIGDSTSTLSAEAGQTLHSEQDLRVADLQEVAESTLALASSTAAASSVADDETPPALEADLDLPLSPSSAVVLPYDTSPGEGGR